MTMTAHVMTDESGEDVADRSILLVELRLADRREMPRSTSNSSTSRYDSAIPRHQRHRA
ncbi:hypothetical protein I6A84_10500 [Frankia sp. CNm7]|uniref:hypothetical protein n=1 Tax=Frankia nepalensis TaxID=1836974 RepID=UPI001932256A|nr:hypothetical protein [Frankia nepalensis]MBL7518529.1 hypothetical protein [Frankia nepalensis]